MLYILLGFVKRTGLVLDELKVLRVLPHEGKELFYARKRMSA